MAQTIRTYKYRLYPTREQIVILDEQLSVCCELYNGAIQERRDAYRKERKPINFYSQSKQLPEIRASRPDVKRIYSQVLQNVLHRVDTNFQAFFRRVKRGEKVGFPRFQPKQQYDSLTYPQMGFSVKNNRVEVAKIGKIKIKLHRALKGVVKTLTIKRKAGKWYATFIVKIDTFSTTKQPLRTAVGLDVGLTTFASLSNGITIENPKYYHTSRGSLRTAQRKLSRRKKFSERHNKAVQLVQAVHSHINNQRSNFHHKLSKELVNVYGLIAVEDLNVERLTKGWLAKPINDAGWSSFIKKLTYKAESAGRVLVKVYPRGTSQRCVCGAPNPKTLADRWHDCKACGLSAPRDHVSARIILGLGLSLQASTWPKVKACVA